MIITISFSAEFLGAWRTALLMVLGSILFILIYSFSGLVQIHLDSKGSQLESRRLCTTSDLQAIQFLFRSISFLLEHFTLE